jgi:hypothetical protein
MSDCTLILAAGKAKRWENRPKQLMPVWDGETVLSRLSRQLRSRGLQPVLLAHNVDIISAFDGLHLDPGETDSVFRTLLKTRDLWRDWNMALLGDVIFTDETMQLIVEESNHLRVFLNPREVYALSWPGSDNAALAEAVRFQADTVTSGGIGYFRKIPAIISGGESVLIRDKTDDVDTPEKYELILAHWSKLEDV